MSKRERMLLKMLVSSLGLAALFMATEALHALQGPRWLRVAACVSFLVYMLTVFWEQAQRHCERVEMLEYDHRNDLDRLDAAWRKRTGDRP